jgi:hypothetical protein
MTVAGAIARPLKLFSNAVRGRAPTGGGLPPAGLGLAMLFNTHDLGVVSSVSDRVLVLERGSARDEGTVDDVLGDPSRSDPPRPDADS